MYPELPADLNELRRHDVVKAIEGQVASDLNLPVPTDVSVHLRLQFFGEDLMALLKDWRRTLYPDKGENESRELFSEDDNIDKNGKPDI